MKWRQEYTIGEWLEAERASGAKQHCANCLHFQPNDGITNTNGWGKCARGQKGEGFTHAQLFCNLWTKGKLIQAPFLDSHSIMATRGQIRRERRREKWKEMELIIIQSRFWNQGTMTTDEIGEWLVRLGVITKFTYHYRLITIGILHRLPFVERLGKTCKCRWRLK